MYTIQPNRLYPLAVLRIVKEKFKRIINTALIFKTIYIQPFIKSNIISINYRVFQLKYR